MAFAQQFVNVPSMEQFRQGNRTPRATGGKGAAILEAIITGSLAGRRSHDERMARLANQESNRALAQGGLDLQRERFEFEKEQERRRQNFLAGGASDAAVTPGSPVADVSRGIGEHPFVEALGSTAPDRPSLTPGSGRPGGVPASAPAGMPAGIGVGGPDVSGAQVGAGAASGPGLLARMLGAQDPAGRGLRMTGDPTPVISPEGISAAVGAPAAMPSAPAVPSQGAADPLAGLKRQAVERALRGGAFSGDPGQISQAVALSEQLGPRAQQQRTLGRNVEDVQQANQLVAQNSGELEAALGAFNADAFGARNPQTIQRVEQSAQSLVAKLTSLGLDPMRAERAVMEFVQAQVRGQRSLLRTDQGDIDANQALVRRITQAMGR